MQFGKSEKIIVGTAATVLLVSGLYFYYGQKIFDDTVDLSKKTNENAIATLEKVVQSVKFKKDKDVSWKIAKTGQKLFDNDRIFTQNDSYADILYQDNVLLNLEPNTLIKIEKKEGKDIDIGLEKGFISLNTSKKNKNVKLSLGGKTLDVNSPDAKIQIRNDGFGDPDIIALGGSAKIKLGDKELNLQQGRRLLLGKDDFRVADNFIELTRPSNGAKLSIGYSSPFYFEWNSNLQGGEFQLEVSDNNSFKKFAKLSRIKKQRAAFYELSPGTYYWRVRGIKQGEDYLSGIYKLEISSVETPVINEKEIEVNLANKDNRTLTLGWKGGEGWSYEIEITDKSNNKINKINHDVNIYNWKVENPNREYSWKVRGLKPESAWSTEGKIVTVYENFLKNLMPNQVYTVPQDFFNGLDFSWEASKGDFVSLEMAEDKQFKKVIFENKKVEQNPILLKLAYEHGELPQVYWRVRSLDYPEQVSETAEIYLRKPVGELITPVDRKIRLSNVKDKVLLKWEIDKKVNPDDVVIQIAEDENFEKSEDFLITPDTVNGISYLFKKTGKYFWRIKYIGNKRDIMNTKMAFMDVNVPNPIASPRIYKKLDLEYRTRSGKEVYYINWEEVPQAIGYILEVFSDPQLIDLVVRKKTDSNNYTWEGRTSGQYYYRVQTLGTAGRISDFSSIGRLIFPIAPLAD